MPFRLIDTEEEPLFIDYEYEITDKAVLAGYVGEIVLGNHFHISKIINALSTTFPVLNNTAIDNSIKKIKEASDTKRDGWFFQMISWIVLAKRHAGQKFYANAPHFAPAQHGLDGLAVILNDDYSLKSIVITEDKCTTQPRNKITSQVYPEFIDFESGNKDNALVSIISSLIGHLDMGKTLELAQSNIYNSDFRIYRIGITRDAEHNDIEGRKNLFKDYEAKVLGDNHLRRSCSTIHLDGMRAWMQDFSEKVIEYLESKKTVDV